MTWDDLRTCKAAHQNRPGTLITMQRLDWRAHTKVLQMTPQARQSPWGGAILLHAEMPKRIPSGTLFPIARGEIAHKSLSL